MSALRMAELILNRTKDRIRENHAAMDKGPDHGAYMKPVGKNSELRWVEGITKEFLEKVEGEEEPDEL